MLDRKKAIKNLEDLAGRKVKAYSYSKDGTLVLITDIGMEIGLNHYLAITEKNFIPTNPILCDLDDSKTVEL